MGWRQRHSWFATGCDLPLDVICHWTPQCFSGPSHRTHDTLLHLLTLLTAHCPKHVTWLSPEWQTKHTCVGGNELLLFSCHHEKTFSRSLSPLQLGLWNGHMWNRPELEPQWGTKWNTAAPQPRSASWMKSNKWWLFYDINFGGRLLCTKSSLILSVVCIFSSI